MPIKRDIIRGDTRHFKVTVVDKTGVPKDITNATVFFTMKISKDKDDTDPTTIQKKVTTHTDPQNGITKVTLLPSDTFDKQTGKYYYDFQIVFNQDEVYTIDEGVIKIVSDVTRKTT